MHFQIMKRLLATLSRKYIRNKNQIDSLTWASLANLILQVI